MEKVIQKIYQMLKDREINPSGKFDKGGRFCATNGNLINVREPSRAWPHSQLTACRSKKYVKAVAEYFNCQSEQELLTKI